MSSLAVVIAAYDADRTIGRTVDSVLACPGLAGAKIIVVDDGSGDETAAKATRPGVTILRMPHRGRAAALNAGIRVAGAELVLFTDADCVVPPTWPDDLLDELGDAHGVGGNLLPSQTTAVELAKMLRYVHEFERGAELRGEYWGVCLNGNNMAIRRDALAVAGGFDESFLHGADADLTRRLLAAGFRLRRTTRSTVTHLKVDGLRSFLRTMWRRGSTVRFGMKSGEENRRTLARAFFSPFRWFLADLRRVRRLQRVLADGSGTRSRFPLDRVENPDAGSGKSGHVPEPSRASGHVPGTRRAWAAPFVNFLGGLVNAAGRIHYYRRFRRGMQ
jgi:GT2 family glycosyltransferase